MGWLQAVDGYCERLGPGFWAEPVNALTNLAFLLAGLVMWRRCASMPRGQMLAALVGVIGIGSFLFHTHANRLTGVLDVIPILLFVVMYMHAAARDFLGLSRWQALMVLVGFVPFAGIVVVLSGALGLGSTATYMPVPLAILISAALLRRSHPGTARGLVWGAGILGLSLAMRWLDDRVCDAVPVGTHFLWHLLNAAMLGWMIEVWRRHMLAGAGARG
jgi:hypothetical protein